MRDFTSYDTRTLSTMIMAYLSNYGRELTEAEIKDRTQTLSQLQKELDFRKKTDLPSHIFPPFIKKAYQG